MEKLLQLLNEYSSDYLGDKEYYIEDGTVYLRERDDDYDQFNYEDFTVNTISKNFGFIKWLVDTEQFDYWKAGEIVDNYKGSLKEKAYVVSDCEYESMLMLLAIQDDPIKFLVSILK